MAKAVKRVAIKTPLALWSLRIRKNKKKATRLSIAPRANRLPMCPCSTAASKVSAMLKSENNKTYKSVPIEFAIIPTTNPIIISFFEFILSGLVVCLMTPQLITYNFTFMNLNSNYLYAEWHGGPLNQIA